MFWYAKDAEYVFQPANLNVGLAHLLVKGLKMAIFNSNS